MEFPALDMPLLGLQDDFATDEGKYPSPQPQVRNASGKHYTSATSDDPQVTIVRALL